MADLPRVRSLAEAEVVIGSIYARQDAILRQLSDHAQRLDTAQTHQWKRLWFWLRWGWPMTDWNAERPNWRPWNRTRRPG